MLAVILRYPARSPASKVNEMSQTRQLLIVDDDNDLRQALVEQLALHPEFQVQAVGTAEAALEALATNTPDLIIMALGQPTIPMQTPCRAWIPAPTITSASRSGSSCCWPEFARSCASMKPARTQSFKSALTPSGQLRRTSSTRRGSNCG